VKFGGQIEKSSWKKSRGGKKKKGMGASKIGGSFTSLSGKSMRGGGWGIKKASGSWGGPIENRVETQKLWGVFAK